MRTRRLLIDVVPLAALMLAGCNPGLRVGELRTESQSVEAGDAEAVRVEIQFGAGELKVGGGAPGLLEADFTYNVDALKPEVEYAGNTLIVGQPDGEGFPAVQGIGDFRNEWDLRLGDGMPMDLRVNIGAGNSDLRLAGLPLTGLHIAQGAGISTIDLSGDWASDLDATIETGAGDVTVRLPSGIGVRVEVETGPTAISAVGLAQDGNVYTNAAYGVSGVTLRIDMRAGVGVITLLQE